MCLIKSEDSIFWGGNIYEIIWSDDRRVVKIYKDLKYLQNAVNFNVELLFCYQRALIRLDEINSHFDVTLFKGDEILV